MIRKIIFFILLVFIWNISLLLFPVNYAYLTTLKGILNVNYEYFIIIYLVTSISFIYSFYRLFIDYDLNNNYNFVFILNYVFSSMLGLFFFKFNTLLLSVICMCVVNVTSIFLYLESKKIDRISSLYVIPSIIFNIFNLISLIIITILN